MSRKTYKAADFSDRLPLLAESDAEITLPDPLMWLDYVTWYQATQNDPSATYEERMVSGALAIGDGVSADDLTLSIAEWLEAVTVVHVADSLSAELPSAFTKRIAELAPEDAKRFGGGVFETADFVDRIPNASAYSGGFRFPEQMTAMAYRAFTKAIQGYASAEDSLNGLHVLYLAADEMILDWGIDDVDQRGDDIPLTVVSMLVDGLLIYLSIQLSKKKSQARLAALRLANREQFIGLLS